MGHFFPSQKGPYNQICCQILNIFRLFLKIWVYFQAFKNSYPQERSRKYEKDLKLKVLVSEKKIASDTNTEIGLWFRFPTPKPGFGHTLSRLTTITYLPASSRVHKISKKLTGL